MKNATSVNHAIEYPGQEVQEIQDGTGRSTYRCYSTSLSDTTLFSEPFTVRSVDQSSGKTVQIERRCKISSVPTNIGQNEATKQDKFVLCYIALYIILKILLRQICKNKL